jgi:hypothetical protein
MKLDKLGIEPDPRARVIARLMAVHTDEKGVLWGLVECGAVGSRDDLWIVRRDGNKWVDPLFTGIDIYPKRVERDASTVNNAVKFAGMSRGELLKSGWYTKLVGDSALRIGDRGNGWTERVFNRLGIDPAKAGSNWQHRDANLLTTQLPETDTEKVLAAAFEGRFRYAEDDVPCVVVMPKGVRPIRFNGWGWMVLAVSDRRQCPVQECFGEGMALITLDDVKFDAAHRQAAVNISTVYAGLDGTGYTIGLKKIGDEWFVVSCEMAWIS